jgi:hypothetical protein
MAPANDAESQRVAAWVGCTSVHSAEMTPMQQAELESKQAIASLYIASQYMAHQVTINHSTEINGNNGDEYIILFKRPTELLGSKTTNCRIFCKTPDF